MPGRRRVICGPRARGLPLCGSRWKIQEEAERLGAANTAQSRPKSSPSCCHPHSSLARRTRRGRKSATEALPYPAHAPSVGRFRGGAAHAPWPGPRGAAEAAEVSVRPGVQAARAR